MANTVLTLSQMENLLWNMTMQMLGFDTTLPANQNKVRIAWPSDGAPSFKIADDVVFIRVTDTDSPYNRQKEVVYSTGDINNANRTVGYTRVHSIKWTLYGPNSYDNADIIRNLIYDPQYTQQFTSNNLFLVLDVPAPMRAPELYNGQWWERTDFTATFNEKIIRTATVPYIKSANNIIKKG